MKEIEKLSLLDHITVKATELKNLNYQSLCSIVHNHKQRRKLWKKEKRRRKRFLAYLNRKICEKTSSNELEEIEDIPSSNDMPDGPLTNHSIICHLRQGVSDNIPDPNKLKGILLNTTSQPLIQNTDSIVENIGVLSEGVKTPKVCDIKITVSMQLSESNTSREEEQCSDNVSNVSEQPEKIVNGKELERPENEKNEINDLLSLLDDEVEKWQNPMAPDDVKAPAIIEPEKSLLEEIKPIDDNRPICNFFLKVGVCRFGDRCSRKHPDIDISDTLLFPNMFQTFAFDMEERNRVRHDAGDIMLEYSEQDLQEEFIDFYEDIKPECDQVGKVLQLLVCSNRSKHICGNVYVQYENENIAKNCFDKMFGRFYNGKQIFCRFVSILSWSSAICGIHQRRGSCQRGGQCNFLHVFKIGEKKFSHRNRLSKYNNNHNRTYIPYGKSRKRSHSHDKGTRRHFYSRSRSRSYSSESDKEAKRRKRKYSKDSNDDRYPSTKHHHRQRESSPVRKDYKKRSSSRRRDYHNRNTRSPDKNNVNDYNAKSSVIDIQNHNDSHKSPDNKIKKSKSKHKKAKNKKKKSKKKKKKKHKDSDDE
ncbi:uncharacterized protein LOC120335822 [Styela clava]